MKVPRALEKGCSWHCKGIISLFQSSDIMIVYFDNKQKVCDKDGIYYGTVDYEFFMGKMVEWGIRLDIEI